MTDEEVREIEGRKIVAALQLEETYRARADDPETAPHTDHPGGWEALADAAKAAAALSARRVNHIDANGGPT